MKWVYLLFQQSGPKLAKMVLLVPIRSVLQYLSTMQNDGEQSVEIRMHRRIYDTRNLCREVKRELEDKILNFEQILRKNKKYKDYREVIDKRMLMTRNFLQGVIDTVFAMVMDEEYISLTPACNIAGQFDKLRKNVNSSLFKILHNLDEDSPSEDKLKLEQEGSNQKQRSEEDLQKQSGEKKSKNFKISTESTEMMNLWLLEHFEHPYPDLKTREKMAEKGNISMTKVNNWFINARERTVKNYFNGKNGK